jgi:very-short-patch-repair endonuclease
MIKYKYLPYNKKLKESARKLRNEMTAAEKKLWYEYLRQSDYIFLRQKVIGNFIVDFYCSELGLVIELDGETHVEENDINSDNKRTEELEKLGLKVLRFWNYDILGGLGEVENIIENEIKKLKCPNDKGDVRGL